MTSGELARQVVEQLKGTPFVLALLVINVIVLAGFAYTLHQVSNAMERRETILQSCIERSRS
ncbi:hypothetical protein [Bradyrhizobium cytisi]|uniref:Uncharacterized protein n=1 Tax=Bradyrhizobium cytisi TaxID=515489 RepID=A0A5S4WZ97_9BRAD|nr:hypothetical protein [Bradyrhizobium cytisi]TYL87420.1 hypothetical protein FXB38_04690 [Bradyrhizobium cytisi]